MGKYLPSGLKITLCVCLGVLMSCGIVVFADTLSQTPWMKSPCPCGKCCVPNARNFGYWETQWRTWPGDQRPEKGFPSAIGAEVIATPPGQVQTPLPKATVLPPKSEAPAPGPESPPAPRTAGRDAASGRGDTVAGRRDAAAGRGDASAE